MRTTITQNLYMREGYAGNWTDKVWRPEILPYKLPDDAESVFIRAIEISVEIPDDFDPVPKQVAALEAEKAEALAKYQETVGKINDRLAKLQAITYEVPA